MERTGSHDPRAVANKILDLRDAEGKPTTIMQLIKLAYIADGWTIALLNRPLTSETPQAWQYGPVYRSIYSEFSGIGARPVQGRASIRGTTVPITEDFDPQEEAIIKMVVDAYGKLSAFALSNLTHQSGTPWSKAYEKGMYTDISLNDIREHFLSLRDKRLVRK